LAVLLIFKQTIDLEQNKKELMDLLSPHTGTIIWMFIAFSFVFLILKKFAWKPILNAIKAREESIEEALKSADKAKEEMQKLQADNEKIIATAKQERDIIIKEARDLKDSIVEDAKAKAKAEADKEVEKAREAIKNEKAAAIKEVKVEVANLSVFIAEKILQEKLSPDAEHKELIDKYLRDIKLN
jgi:F-type H+-transporting ATPase subunit b